MIIAEPLYVLIEELSKLPTIGKKTAQRLALHLLKTDKADVDLLIKAISELKEKIKFCQNCFNISVDDLCSICSSNKRNHSVICVVEEASDIIAIEKTNEFNGLYHVLGGVLSPLSGVSSDNLKIRELVKRIETTQISEIILALNPDAEGETTSLYLSNLLKPFKIKITRIARGLPVGGDLEFADDATISRAVLNRIEM